MLYAAAALGARRGATRKDAKTNHRPSRRPARRRGSAATERPWSRLLCGVFARKSASERGHIR